MNKKAWTSGVVVSVMMGGAAFGLAGCAASAVDSKREARLDRMSDAAGEKAALVERLVLFDREQETLAGIAMARTQDPIVKAFAQSAANDYRQHRDALRRWETDRTRELTRTELNLNMSGVGGSGGQMSPEQLAETNSQFHNDPIEPQIRIARDQIAQVNGAGQQDFDKAFLDRFQHNAFDAEQLTHDGEAKFEGDAVLAALLFQTEPLLKGHQASADRMRKYLRSTQ